MHYHKMSREEFIADMKKAKMIEEINRDLDMEDLNTRNIRKETSVEVKTTKNIDDSKDTQIIKKAKNKMTQTKKNKNTKSTKSNIASKQPLQKLEIDATLELKKLRESTGLSQVKFADKFDIPLTTYRHWEFDVKPPVYVVKMIEKILKYENTK